MKRQEWHKNCHNSINRFGINQKSNAISHMWCIVKQETIDEHPWNGAEVPTFTVKKHTHLRYQWQSWSDDNRNINRVSGENATSWPQKQASLIIVQDVICKIYVTIKIPKISYGLHVFDAYCGTMNNIYSELASIFNVFPFSQDSSISFYCLSRFLHLSYVIP